MHAPTSIFRSAITDTDGLVDAGFLALFWIMAVVITAIPFMCALTAVAMFLDPVHKFDVQSLGIGIGSVCTGFGVAIGAVGAFRAGDKPRAGVATTTTTTTASTAAVPAPVTITGITGPAPDALLNAARGVEPMPAKIGPEDVGKRAALVERVKPKRRKRARKA